MVWVFSGDLRFSGGGRRVGGFGWGDVGGAFEEFALVEGGAGADEGDQVWGIDGSPAGLRGLDELVGHCHPGRTRTRPLGHSRSQTYCGEVTFDWVGSPEVHPVFGGILVKLQQGVEVVDDLGDRFGILGAKINLEGFDRNLGLGVRGVLTSQLFVMVNWPTSLMPRRKKSVHPVRYLMYRS